MPVPVWEEQSMGNIPEFIYWMEIFREQWLSSGKVIKHGMLRAGYGQAGRGHHQVL